jgi:hypothetical protein
MKRLLAATGVAVLAVWAVAALTGAGGAGAAAKPAANPQATVVFLNAATDSILSDGSAYAGGVSGVVAEIQGGGSGPLLLNIVNTSSKPKRYLLYKYPESAKIDLSAVQSPSPYPCGYYPGNAGPTSATTGVKVAGYVNLHSIGQMQIGEARAVRIHFGADAGQFLWLSPHNVATGSCSSTVVAYRQTKTMWYVGSDISRIPGGTTLPGVRLDPADNVYEVLGTDPSWWDRPSAVSQLNAGPSLGNYVMPFAMSVSCPKCPAPPTCQSWPCAIDQ